MAGSKSFFPQPCAALMVKSRSEEIHLCCCVRKYFSFVCYGLLFRNGLSKKNQKIQETGHMDGTVFGMSCLFKASGNWDGIIKASSC